MDTIKNFLTQVVKVIQKADCTSHYSFHDDSDSEEWDHRPRNKTFRKIYTVRRETNTDNVPSTFEPSETPKLNEYQPDLDCESVHTAIENIDTTVDDFESPDEPQSPQTTNNDEQQGFYFGFYLQNYANRRRGHYYRNGIAIEFQSLTKTVFWDMSTPGSLIEITFNENNRITFVTHEDEVYYSFDDLPSRVADYLVKARVIINFIANKPKAPRNFILY